jgi:hypothetical protein
MFYFPLSSLFKPSQPPPYYDKIGIILWNYTREVGEIKNYEYVLSRTNTHTAEIMCATNQTYDSSVCAS